MDEATFNEIRMCQEGGDEEDEESFTEDEDEDNLDEDEDNPVHYHRLDTNSMLIQHPLHCASACVMHLEHRQWSHAE